MTTLRLACCYFFRASGAQRANLVEDVTQECDVHDPQRGFVVRQDGGDGCAIERQIVVVVESLGSQTNPAGTAAIVGVLRPLDVEGVAAADLGLKPNEIAKSDDSLVPEGAWRG